MCVFLVNFLCISTWPGRGVHTHTHTHRSKCNSFVFKKQWIIWWILNSIYQTYEHDVIYIYYSRIFDVFNFCMAGRVHLKHLCAHSTYVVRYSPLSRPKGPKGSNVYDLLAWFWWYAVVIVNGEATACLQQPCYSLDMGGQSAFFQIPICRQNKLTRWAGYLWRE